MLKSGMLKTLLGPNVKIRMGQSFRSCTHGHGSMARRGSDIISKILEITTRHENDNFALKIYFDNQT